MLGRGILYRAHCVPVKGGRAKSVIAVLRRRPCQDFFKRAKSPPRFFSAAGSCCGLAGTTSNRAPQLTQWRVPAGLLVPHLAQLISSETNFALLCSAICGPLDMANTSSPDRSRANIVERGQQGSGV